MNEPKPDLVRLLRELEQRRADEGMPLGGRNRVQLAIRSHPTARGRSWRRWVPAVSFVAGAALVLAVVGTRWSGSDASHHSDRPAAVVAATPELADEARPAVGQFRVEGPTDRCDGLEHRGVATLVPECSLVAEHMTVQAWESATIRAQGRNVGVTSGKVLFDVRPIGLDEAPVEVRVSHGRIEVVGTRFAVEQQDGGGHVDLLEGKIRFHHPDGRVDDVLPGERLSWGAAAPQRPEVELVESVETSPIPDTGARKRSRRATRAQAAAVIERVTELRAQKRYGAAVTELRRALRRKWDKRTAQVLSYELGELLRAAEDTLGACEHFAEHQRRYPSGRYEGAINRRLDRLDCG